MQEKPYLITADEVLNLVPISRSTRDRMVKEGTFPSPVKIGARRIAFKTEDVQNWLASRSLPGNEGNK